MKARWKRFKKNLEFWMGLMGYLGPESIGLRVETPAPLGATLREAQLKIDGLERHNATLLKDFNQVADRRCELEEELDRLRKQCSAPLLPLPACLTAELNREQIERLGLLAQVSGRIAAEVGWVLREGWAGPAEGVPNRVAMERELGRLRAVVDLMHGAGEVRGGEMKAWQEKHRGILAMTTRFQG